MNFHYENYSVWLLFLVLNLALCAGILAIRGWQSRRVTEMILALYLTMSALFIVPWMLGFGGWYSTQPTRDLLLYIPMNYMLFMGPVLFFYVRQIIWPGSKPGNIFFHLAPGFCWLIAHVCFFVVDKILLHRYYFLADEFDPDFNRFYLFAGNFSQLVYLVLCYKAYQKYRRQIVNYYSFADDVTFRWLQRFMIAYCLFLAIGFLFSVANLFYPIRYVNSWWYFWSFGIVVLYIGVSGIFHSVRAETVKGAAFTRPGEIDLTLNTVPDIADEVTESTEEAGYPRDFAHSIEVVRALIIGEKLYHDPMLSLREVSIRTNIRMPILSRVFNEGMGQNFNDFINEQRINDVKGRIRQGALQNYTLVGIAYDAGFNSKATFNRAFKKFTGESPTQWIQNLGSTRSGGG